MQQINIHCTHRDTCVTIQKDHSYFEGWYTLNQLRQNAECSRVCISSLMQSYCLLMRQEDPEPPEPTSARTSMGNGPDFWNLHTLKQWLTQPMYELDVYRKSAIWMQFLQWNIKTFGSHIRYSIPYQLFISKKAAGSSMQHIPCPYLKRQDIKLQ